MKANAGLMPRMHMGGPGFHRGDRDRDNRRRSGGGDFGHGHGHGRRGGDERDRRSGGGGRGGGDGGGSGYHGPRNSTGGDRDGPPPAGAKPLSSYMDVDAPTVSYHTPCE
jgi:hypothetical protein